MSSMQTFSIVGNCLQGTLPAQCAPALSPATATPSASKATSAFSCACCLSRGVGWVQAKCRTRGRKPLRTLLLAEEVNSAMPRASVSLATCRIRWASGGVNAWPELRQLHLRANLLTGSLPGAWGGGTSFAALQNITLSGNSLTGALPANWTQYRRLQALMLLPGELPAPRFPLQAATTAVWSTSRTLAVHADG